MTRRAPIRLGRVSSLGGMPNPLLHRAKRADIMIERFQFAINRIRERLWVKPLLVCVVSVIGVLLASRADGTGLGEVVPDVSRESLESLLKIVASSMLVMATFAVGSMVSAYASASRSGTPRAFALVVADDVSQNALSTFVGVFIYGVVALLALMNGFYGRAGRFVLFVLTALVFALVIVAFVRWVDSIARLGRLGNTIKKVEAATLSAFDLRRKAPRLGGVAPSVPPTGGLPIVADTIGYVQMIDVEALQERAEAAGYRVTVAALPGAFCTPDRPVAFVVVDGSTALTADDASRIVGAFRIGPDRTFDHDPRFGLVVLSEIASRALSPAVNDPGTAIQVTGALIRLFSAWAASGDDEPEVRFDRIVVPELIMDDLFDDAFTGIARDGAGMVEVGIRLQKAFATLASLGHGALRDSAIRHARLALDRAEGAITFAPDIDALRRAADIS